MRETRPGTVIGGRYRLEVALARGGFGVVWKAHDLRLELAVAVKEVYLPPATSPEEHAARLTRARREARHAAALRDRPHIVAVHDMVIEEDRPWMVMRLVDGRSLEQHISARGVLPAGQAMRAARCLLGALAAAHGAGIVHRDVKPANVMMTADGDCLLTDFGIAQHATDTSLTGSGAVIGSLEYMAPERFSGQDLPAGDLFSLGVTLYQATEGVSPFLRGDAGATLAALLRETPPVPRNAGELTGVITALLDKEPRHRPTADEALRLLDAPATRHAATAVDRATQRKFAPPHVTDAARARAAEKHIDLRQIKGSGRNGSITVQDVYAAEGDRSRQRTGGDAGLSAVGCLALLGAVVGVVAAVVAVLAQR
ncbi:protein kinase [Streptomyces sp. SID5785]|uniref:protein kinase domain-containing protein n=1 Tax=Streptomyces sp. SID5785 TaxID=2690309 RepID=UPI0013611E12|nr:protein kinase [Streptomyces sp. SID5785]